MSSSSLYNYEIIVDKDGEKVLRMITPYGTVERNGLKFGTDLLCYAEYVESSKQFQDIFPEIYEANPGSFKYSVKSCISATLSIGKWFESLSSLAILLKFSKREEVPCSVEYPYLLGFAESKFELSKFIEPFKKRECKLTIDSLENAKKLMQLLENYRQCLTNLCCFDGEYITTSGVVENSGKFYEFDAEQLAFNMTSPEKVLAALEKEEKTLEVGEMSGILEIHKKLEEIYLSLPRNKILL